MGKVGYGGMDTHYEDYGWGDESVLFLHTWVGTSTYWLNTMSSMPVQSYTVAPDFWGFGKSGRPTDMYSLDGYLRQMRELVQHLQLTNLTIVGHGLGAVVGLHMVTRVPEAKVKRLVGIALPVLGDQVDDWLKGARTPDIYSRYLRSGPGYNLARDGLAASDWIAVARTAREVAERSFRPQLEACRVPLLLIHGAHDRVVQPPTDRWLKRLGTVDHVMMENSSHFPMLDEPQYFHTLLGEFLRGERERKPPRPRFL